MGDQDEVAGFAIESDQDAAEQGRRGQIKWPACLLGRDLLQPRFLRVPCHGIAFEHDQLRTQICDDLAPHLAVLSAIARTQGLVPDREFLHRLLKRIHANMTFQTQGHKRIADGGVLVHLMLDPQSLLSIGQVTGRLLRWIPGARCPGFRSHLQCFGELPDRLVPEALVGSEREPSPARPCADLDGPNRITAHRDEIILHADRLQPQYLAPDVGQRLFLRRFGGTKSDGRRRGILAAEQQLHQLALFRRKGIQSLIQPSHDAIPLRIGRRPPGPARP